MQWQSFRLCSTWREPKEGETGMGEKGHCRLAGDEERSIGKFDMHFSEWPS